MFNFHQRYTTGIVGGSEEVMSSSSGPPNISPTIPTCRLVIIAHESVNQDQLWKLCDFFPGLEWCQVRLENRQCLGVAVYNTPSAASFALKKMHGFEYPTGNRLIVKFDNSATATSTSSVDGGPSTSTSSTSTLMLASSSTTISGSTTTGVLALTPTRNSKGMNASMSSSGVSSAGSSGASGCSYNQKFRGSRLIFSPPPVPMNNFSMMVNQNRTPNKMYAAEVIRHGGDMMYKIIKTPTPQTPIKTPQRTPKRPHENYDYDELKYFEPTILPIQDDLENQQNNDNNNRKKVFAKKRRLEYIHQDINAPPPTGMPSPPFQNTAIFFTHQSPMSKLSSLVNNNCCLQHNDGDDNEYTDDDSIELEVEREKEKEPVAVVQQQQQQQKYELTVLEDNDQRFRSDMSRLNQNFLWAISLEINNVNWKRLGRTLGLDENTLVNIENSYKDGGYRECAFQMLTKWQQIYPQQCTFGTLYKGFCKENMNLAAKTMINVEQNGSD